MFGAYGSDPLNGQSRHILGSQGREESKETQGGCEDVELVYNHTPYNIYAYSHSHTYIHASTC